MKTPMSALALPQTAPRRDGAVLHALERRRRRRRMLALVGAAVFFCLVMMWRLSSRLPTPAPIHASVVEQRRRRFEVENQLDEERKRDAHHRRTSRGFRNDKNIVVLLTSDRDADVCARQLVDAHASAFRAVRVHFRLFEEHHIGQEKSCIEELCDLEPEVCQALLRTQQLRYQRRDVSGALGPTVARHLVEGMVDPEEFGGHFYLSVDSSVEFTKDWDLELLKQWYSIGNDMAILSAAPKPLELRGITNDTLMMHCSARIASKGADAVVEFNPPEPKPKASSVLFAPVLQAQYSELFHFGSVAALLAVRSDPHTPYITVGHEYARASRFWTKGYDFYTPIYDTLLARYDQPAAAPHPSRAEAVARSNRRIRRLLGLSASVSGEALDEEALYSLGDRRSMAQWTQFARIDPQAAYNESTTNQFTACDQELHYVPY
jgi:hypothetical protein